MASFLTSDQVNYLIWKYLQESGFDTSAYSFQHQSKADRLDDLYKPFVRTGYLIHLIQRGLQYEELRSQVDLDGTIRKSTKVFQVFPPVPSLLSDVDDKGPVNGHIDEDDDDNERVNGPLNSPPSSLPPPPVRKHGLQDDGINGVSKRRKKKQPGLSDGDTVMVDAQASSPGPEEPRITNGRSLGVQVGEIVEELSESIVLGDGDNDDQVFTFQWNPVQPTLLATAGTGPRARIRDVPVDAAPSDSLEGVVVSHEPATDRADITALWWSPIGDRLATGSHDGQTRIWLVDGVLEHTLFLHFAPINSLVWNNSGTVLLSLSCDGKIIAWDTISGELIDTFEMGQGQAGIADIEWVDESQFVACSTEGQIFYCDVRQHVIESKAAHVGEVNCVRWDQFTETIASAGADKFVSIWQKPLKGSSPEKLPGHKAAVVEVAWQPNPVSLPDSPRRILASSSEDHTVRLWEVTSKSCIHVLDRHNYPIHRICFSPNGKQLASGTNGKIILWRTDSGELTHIYDCAKSTPKNGVVPGSQDDIDLEVTDISWDETGDRIAIGIGRRRCMIVRIGTKP